MTTTHHQRSAIGVLGAGLVLSIAATVVPWVDRATANVLADHIRAGYPAYDRARVDSAVTTYLIYLSVLGALGVVGWLWTIWAVKAGKRWARAAATAMFVLGAGIAVFDLLVKDTSGDTGLPAVLGWIGTLPSLAGLLAVVLLWTSPAAGRRSPLPRSANPR